MSTSAFNLNPIGYISTCYSAKNGTPRQPSVSSVSKGELTISKAIFNNPHHSLEGLNQFSHLWIIFVFHLNEGKCVKSKVKPPRMNGIKTGVFSTRSPHRPNPVGLTLAKIESIENDTVYLSGLDIVDGTPVIDIKPFIPHYDIPKSDLSSLDIAKECLSTLESDRITTKTSHSDLVNANDNKTSDLNVINCKEKLLCQQFKDIKMLEQQDTMKVAGWISQPPIPKLEVLFSTRALKNLEQFKQCSTNKIEAACNDWSLTRIDPEELQQAVLDILTADPRSSYRREKCSDKLYYFTLDNAHITAWFDHSVSPHCVEVLRIIPKHLANL